ncbi:MAG: HAMP domain-containing protein [Rhodospirillales bacterium]|nr:MAG: HAMP domain-containing protein [Rhodospirillales bacterium]
MYLAVFAATLAGVLGFIYWSTSDLIERQTNNTIRAEIRGLSEQYRDEGLTRLIEIVRERSRRNEDLANVYLLTDPFYRPLAGNLETWPQAPEIRDGWAEIRLRHSTDPAETERQFRARLFELQGGFHLMVGRDTAAHGNFRRIMHEGVAWALIPVLVVGLGGGILVGRYALRRVDAVAATSHEIVSGDLTRRVPLSGSGDEFDRLARTINEMLDQIDALMTGMRAVTDSLAHDLRSPLTRARGSIEQALRGATDIGTYRAALEHTAAELDMILQTFEALINIALAEAGSSRETMSQLDLSRLVQDLVEVYQPSAEEAGLELTARIAPGLAATGHRQLLGQAVANLLDNAIKFTPPGGRIEVLLETRDDQSILRVADNGPGIPAEHRQRVVRRFARLDSSRSTPGSGLGLSLVAAVARLHGATFTLGDNQPGVAAILALPS